MGCSDKSLVLRAISPVAVVDLNDRHGENVPLVGSRANMPHNRHVTVDFLED